MDYQLQVEIRGEGRKVSEGGVPVLHQGGTLPTDVPLLLAESGPEEVLDMKGGADNGARG